MKIFSFVHLLRLGTFLAVGLSSMPLMAIVTIQTNDGRELSGEVDEQTDNQFLWLRQESDQILLTTSVPWTSITSATDVEGALPLEQLPEILQAQATAEPEGFLLQHAVYHAPVGCQGDCKPLLQSPRRRLPPTAKVRSLDIDAFLVNLDRDVEPDGLELRIAALDNTGMPVPVKGTLYARLWGERIQPHGSLVRYEDLQQWTQPVVPIDFIDGVASYALQFRTVHPDQDWRLHSAALVNVRLGVFGQGNFSASVPVRIRQFNPVRNRLQLMRGSRYFPNEVTQETRQQLRPRTHTRQLRIR